MVTMQYEYLYYPYLSNDNISTLMRTGAIYAGKTYLTPDLLGGGIIKLGHILLGYVVVYKKRQRTICPDFDSDCQFVTNKVKCFVGCINNIMGKDYILETSKGYCPYLHYNN